MCSEVGVLPTGVVPAVAGPEPLLPCSLPDQDLPSGNGSPHLSPLLIFIASFMMVLMLQRSVNSRKLLLIF